MSSIPSLTISQLVELIERTPAATPTKLVAIDGRGGSGKSTLADALSKSRLEAQVVHVDDFPCRAREYPFHQSGTQTRVNLDRLRTEVLLPLRAGERTDYAKTPWWAAHVSHLETKLTATPGGTVIVEGCYVLHRKLRELFDVRVWVECPSALGAERALKRDACPEISHIWRDVYVPNESAYISAYRPQEAADIIVCNDVERLFSIEEKTYDQALRRLAVSGAR
jgi:uridine kinase